MDIMGMAIRDHEQATIEVDLSDSVLYPETNITKEELYVLNSILEKLKNRDFKMGVRGGLYTGYVYKSEVLTSVEYTRPTMNLYIQF